MPRLLPGLVLCLLPLAAVGAGIGQPAPALDLPVLQNGAARVSLASLRGKVVYLDFWASWCGPCRVSFPQLDDLHEELSPRGFEVLAVSVDETREDALAFLRELPVGYPVAWDGGGVTPQAYDVLGMPTGYLIDRDGKVRLVHRGFRRGDGARLRSEIVKLLEE